VKKTVTKPRDTRSWHRVIGVADTAYFGTVAIFFDLEAALDFIRAEAPMRTLFLEGY